MEKEDEPSGISSLSLATVSDMEEDTSRPLIVRIKRKRQQLPIEALWLEVSERPTKRLEAELLAFSLSNSDAKRPDSTENSKSGRLLFHHVDTVTSFGTEEATRVNSLLREFDNGSSKEKPRTWVKSKHGKLSTATSREKHQEIARKARFEQVWRSRKGVTKPDNLSELFHLYDIVRVDLEADIIEKQESEAELAEKRLLQDFLPLFKEYLPSVAAEVESSTASSLKKVEASVDDYVFDVYALQKEGDGGDLDTRDYPMIKVVDDEDFTWGESSESDYDSEDSNDENNPLNDYPEEEDDSEADSSVSHTEAAGKKHYVGSDVSEEYVRDDADECEETWDSAGYDSGDEWR